MQDFADPNLIPVAAEELLGHLRPVEQYAIEELPGERRDAIEMRRYLVSAEMHRGAEVRVALRLCLADPAAAEIVLSIPGGGGGFPDDALWWLAAGSRRNYAAIDWIGRGQSPVHEALVCRYDPIMLDGDTFRDSFLFHNLSAIWAALNWLFATGRRPVDIVGGSWGGVFSFLLAALDRRIERIFATFGCGGFCLPGVEKRSMWDAAFEHMGQMRTAEWCRAFDPLLRLSDCDAAVYYETATNDKFFSLDMAMATWRRIRNPQFLGILANQDHTMHPFGVQPYIVQRLAAADLAHCRAVTTLCPEWHAAASEVACLDLAEASGGPLSLLWSEQAPPHGNMSRDWQQGEALAGADGKRRFRLARSSADGQVLYFLSGRVQTADGTILHAATPVAAAEWTGCDSRILPGEPYSMLLEAREGDPVGAPIGDKSHPAVAKAEGGWTVAFTGVPRSRVTRFGICPWRLPAQWECIEVLLKAPLGDSARHLDLVLSRRYQHFDEEALIQPFLQSEAGLEGTVWVYRFHRDGFVPGVIVEQRFRPHALPQVADIIDDFDAVSIADMDGTLNRTVTLVWIAIR